MKTLVMFVAPVVAAFATATELQKRKETKRANRRTPHQKSGIAPVGNACFTIDAPDAPLSFWELGICRQTTYQP